jgi:RNA polymerase sigma-70 factor (ECF subfamily)
MDEEEQALLKQARAGDAQALLALLEARRPRLLTYINRMLGASLRGKVEADDIVQEVSLSALKSLGNVYLDNSDPFPWFCYLARQRIIDAGRCYAGTQKRAVARELSPVVDHGSDKGDLFQLIAASVTSPSGAFSRQSREGKLSAAIARLSDEQQTILKLRFVEELSSKEIAMQIGKTHGAVRTLLSRILDRLQEDLGQDEDFESLHGAG